MTAALAALAKIALLNNQFSDSLATYTKALNMATEHNFYQYLPTIYDGLAVNNFIAGDFWMSIKNRNHSVNLKKKFDYPEEDLLLEHMKLGELNALVGNLQTSFSEFEQALNHCMQLGKKDELYFDILIWLFEISTSLEEFTLADSYIGRAELFASIHNSEEENVQALISRTRFLIQKNELEEATKILEVVFEKAQEFPSPLTMALALIEKGMILLLQFIKEHDSEVSTALIQTIENMVFISLDLEFLPLTMFAKKALAKVYLYENNMTEAIEELQEAVEFAQTLGMISFEVSLREEIDEINGKYNSLTDKEFDEVKEELLEKAREDLKQTFWLVNASEHQRIDN
jgi:tetratricopeptide (TPR) repeat protein